MRHHKTLSILASLTLVGCASTYPTRTFDAPTDRVPLDRMFVQSRFIVMPMTKDNLGVLVSNCIPKRSNAISINKAEEHISASNNNLIVFGHAGSSKKFLITRQQGICLSESVSGFPILAGEALIGTANPEGIPPSITDDWYVQITSKLASQGRAKVAFILRNGNANIANYWFTESVPKIEIIYSNNFKRKGEWETETFDLKFATSEMQHFSVTEYSNQRKKTNPISHRANY
jgi:hypothetical protein